MSYQPQPMQPMPPQMGQYAQPGASKGKGLKVLGIVLLVAGLAGGAALIVLGVANKEATVKAFARAPVGCTTTLEFDTTGEFTLFVETKGSVPDVDGDCANDGVAYERGADGAPDVALQLTDADEAAVSLGDADGPSYSAGEYAGVGVHTVTIDKPGSYLLTVTSADTDFAIAVGGDPEGDSALMMVGGVAAIAAGVVLGLLLILLGGRRGRAQPAAVAWQPAPQWPQQPTVPGYQVPGYQVPGYQAPGYQTPQQWPPAAPPQAPPAPPPGQGWGAPQQ